MKKLFLFSFLMGLTLLLNGQTVISADDAVSAALRFANRGFYAVNPAYSENDVEEITPIIDNEDTLLFFVRIGDSTIVVSRLKCFPPILAFFEVNRNGGSTIDCPGANYFIQRYCEKAKKAIREKESSISPKWDQLFSSNAPKTNPLIIPPLLTTRWGQSSSNSYDDNCAYNYYVTDTCSHCSDCSKSPVGCVAVAIGQIMNYWKYPVFRFDKSKEHQFEWCNMSDELTTANPNYTMEKLAVARLLRDCGTACDMNYCYLSRCQSFAWPAKALSALVDTFMYSPDAFLARRPFRDDEWKQMLIDELVEGRPIFYACVTQDSIDPSKIGGHAFVCDGYRESDGFFSFNFGWNGAYNGYYNIDALVVDTVDYNNIFERAIFNIHPLPESFLDFCNSTLSLYDYYSLYYGFFEEDDSTPFDNVPTTSSFLYSVPDELDVPPIWNTIPAGESANYIAHKEIVLLPGFTIQRGADFSAIIDPCDGCDAQGELYSLPSRLTSGNPNAKISGYKPFFTK